MERSGSRGGAGDNTGALAANPFFSQGQGASLIADSLTPWDAQSKRVYGEDGTAPTLCNSDGRGVKHNQPIVALQSDGGSSNGAQNGSGYDESGSAYTLNGRDRQSVAYGFKFHQGSGARGLGFGEEESPTLTADWHNPAVMTRQEPVILMSDTQPNCTIDDQAGGGAHGADVEGPARCSNSNGGDVFPSLNATDGDKQFIDNQSVNSGRLIVEWRGHTC